MLAPSPGSIHDPDLLPALRDLFNQHPPMTRSDCKDVSRALFVLRYMTRYPAVFEVEAAREALLVESAVLA